MPPSPTIHLARRLGAVYGLSEGPDGPACSPLKYDFDAETKIFDVTNKLSHAQECHFASEFQALFFPSFLRTFAAHPPQAFDAVHASMLLSYLMLPSRNTGHACNYRFAREHPRDFLAFKDKLLPTLVYVLDVYEAAKDPSLSTKSRVARTDLAFVLFDQFVPVHQNACLVELQAHGDGIPRAGSGPLSISPVLRAQLRERWSSLDELEQRVNGDAAVRDPVLELIRGAVFPEASCHEIIDKLLGPVGLYIPWWRCDCRHPGLTLPETNLCDDIQPDELRACGRCQSVRYCGERHQKDHWPIHKPFCIAPTW